MSIKNIINGKAGIKRSNLIISICKNKLKKRFFGCIYERLAYTTAYTASDH